MKVTTPRIVLIRRPTLYVAALGALAFATTVACSDDPVSPLGTAGTSPGVAGTTPTTAGTSSTAAGTGGAPVGVAGTSFGNAGTPATGGTGTAGTAAGGTGGTATGGTGTGGSGTAGTGGVYVPPPPYCEGKTPATLPFEVTTAFYASAWQGLFTQITATSPTDLCAQRTQGAVGGCSRWTVTADAAAPAWTAVAWVNRADANFTHDPVCLAAGAKRISFFAKGAAGGEQLSCGGGGVNAQGEVLVTLTTDWKEYSVPLTGVDYNNAQAGVPSGFSWKVEPMIGDAPVVFAIDNIRFVATDAPGSGGSGGAGGTGGSGGASGGSGGAAAGTGGASGGTGGTGGAGGTN